MSNENEEFVDVTDELIKAPQGDDEFVDITEQTLKSSPIPSGTEAIQALTDNFSGNVPWQNKFAYEGMDINIDDPEQKKVMQNQGIIDNIFKPLKDAGATTIKTALDVVSIPTNIASGLYSRISNLGSDYNSTEGYASQALDKFLNPPEVDDLRKFQTNFIEKFQNEISPQLLPSDVVNEKIKGVVGSGVINALIPNTGGFVESMIGQNGKKALDDFATNVLMDPAMAVDFLPRIATMAPELAATVNALIKEGKFAEAVELSSKVRSGGLAEQAKRGERALLAVKVPLTDITLMRYKGLKALERLDDYRAWGEANIGQKGARLLSQETGLPLNDALSQSKHIKQASDQIRKAQWVNELNALGAQDETVQRISSMMAEHGEEPGLMLAEKAKLSATPEQIQKARALNLKLKEITEYSNAKYGQVSGNEFKLDDYKPPTQAEKEAIKKYYKETYGVDLPTIRVSSADPNAPGAVSYDLTFSGYNGYDYGRALKDEVAYGDKVVKEIADFDSSVKSSGFATTSPSSSKSRNKLSTEAINAIYNQLGVADEVFNPNKVQVVLEKAGEKLQSARNLEYFNSIADAYGVLPGQERAVIQAAQKKVLEGTATYEDKVLAQMKVSDFKRVNPELTKKFKSAYGEGHGSLIKTERLSFPKSVSRNMESLLIQDPPANLVLGFANKFQQLLSKSMLTGGLRFVPQYVDNLSRVMATRAIPEFILETANAARALPSKLPGVGKYLTAPKAKDAVSQIMENMPGIVDTAWDLGDFRGPIKVNYKVMTDKKVNEAYYSFIETLHSAAKEGKALDVLGIGKQALSKAKDLAAKGIQWPVDNYVSRTIRGFGASADNISRKALFRKYYNQGYSIGDAYALVQKELMDFQTTSNAVKGMRYVIPFASFQLKNLETLPKLLMHNPGMANLLRPDEKGYLTKALTDWQGWEPQDIKLMTKLLPINRHPMFAMLMRGNKEVIDNLPFVDKKINEWMSKGLNPDQMEKFPGMVVTSSVPSFVGAAYDFTALQDALGSPYSKALMAAASINPFTAEPIPNQGGRERFREAMAQVNPYSFPKFYDKVAMPLMAEFAPGMVKALKDGPFGADIEKIMRINFGDAPMDRIKLDQDTIRNMTSMKSFGLARIDQLDFSYFHQQRSLMASAEALISERGGPGSIAEAALKTGKKQEVLRLMGRLQGIISNIKENTKLFEDMRERIDRTMTADEARALENTKFQHDEESDGTEQVPQDNSIPDDDRDVIEDDEAYIPQEQDRMPAGVLDGPRLSVDEQGNVQAQTQGQNNPGYAGMWQESLYDGRKPEGQLKPNGQRMLEDVLREKVQESSQGLENLQEYREPTRQPAAKAVRDFGGPSEMGSAGPMASGAGASAMMMGGALGAQAIGLRANPTMRRMVAMDDATLDAQPESDEKSFAQELRGQKPWSIRRGTKVTILGEEAKKPSWFGDTNPDQAYEFLSDGNTQRPLIPNYLNINIESNDPKYKGDSHWSMSKAPKTASWVRGFAPNPDTFLIVEAQRNPKDKASSEKDAIRATIEYARKAGYKKLGILNSRAVSRVQGLTDPGEVSPDFIAKRYGNWGEFNTFIAEELTPKEQAVILDGNKEVYKSKDQPNEPGFIYHTYDLHQGKNRKPQSEQLMEETGEVPDYEEPAPLQPIEERFKRWLNDDMPIDASYIQGDNDIEEFHKMLQARRKKKK